MEIPLLIMENHGNVFLNFCGNPKNSIAIFHTSSGKAGFKAGVVLSVFYRRYFEDFKYNIVVQNQHGLCPNIGCPNIGCYIDLVLKIFLVR